ncbi:helix-turn-helix domain-containing protein [Rhodococcus sp. BP-262]|uniref:helix-turn-helix domain-containing protein n=1 Tax=unclassified Rhodococcus (in: high G+C Gram-positive bacteria) TaxID=192944 RepID=UPI0035A82AF6
MIGRVIGTRGQVPIRPVHGQQDSETPWPRSPETRQQFVSEEQSAAAHRNYRHQEAGVTRVRNQGSIIGDIADRFGVSRRTLYRHLEKMAKDASRE